MDTKIKMGFDPTIAKDVGVDCAIVFSNIEFWIDTNARNKINFHENKYWMYNSIKAFCEQFPFFTEQNIKTILKKLISGGYLIKGRFNKKGYDKTSWYALGDRKLEVTNHRLESTNQLVSSNQPIPDTKTYNKPDTNIIIGAEQEVVDTPIKTTIRTDGKLPEIRGKTYILRIFSVYRDLFFDKYRMSPHINLPRFGKEVKSLIEKYSELQISAMMVTFFNWRGMRGDDENEYNKIISATCNPFWFFSTIQSYEVYLRNVHKLEFDNEDEVRSFVAKNLLALNKS